MAKGHIGYAVRQLFHLVGGTELAWTDRQLLDRFASHRDQAAFEILVQRHGPLVLGVCRRILIHEHDAEDAFQATFLLLARKAGSVFWHESIGNWLYGAAFRIATRARNQATTRHRREREARTMMGQDADTSSGWDDLRPVIDEELERLPEKYRMPLLLCYLQGHTREETALRLGWTAGVVKGRLERGRDLLRQRLARRGLHASAVALPAVLAQGVVSACPPALIQATVNTVGGAAVPATIATMLKGGMKGMFWARIKTMVITLVAFGLIGSGAGLAVYQIWGSTSVPVDVVPIEKGPQASRPAEKDGLSVTVKPAKKRFAANEPLAFHLTFTNASKKILVIYNFFPRFGHDIRLVNVGNGISWQFKDCSGLPVPPAPPIGRSLPAGKSFEQVIRFDPIRSRTDRYIQIGKPVRMENGRACLPPGKYRVQVRLSFANVASPVVSDLVTNVRMQLKDLKQPWVQWHGELKLNPATFEVVAAVDRQIDEKQAREIALAAVAKPFPVWRKHHDFRRGDPIRRATLSPDRKTWKVRFSADNGKKAMLADITIDATTGRVVEVKVIPGA